MGKLEAISRCPKFRDFSAIELALLAAVVEIREYTSAQIICKEGTESQGMFIIVDGEIGLSQRRLQDGKVLTTLSTGETLGELSIFGGTQHLMTAKVLSESATCACLSDRGFEKLVKAKPTVALKLLQAIGVVMAEKFKAALA